ncbi:hypothetical protein MLD38_017223 [Melastoma candidum]|nr:hypothetical protein MLD38_017223 [Melastoma candidum]
MVFYKGRSPNVQKTKWKMNEYRAIEEERPGTPVAAAAVGSVAIPKVRYEYSLCRVYVVSGNFRAFDRRPLAITEGSIGGCPGADRQGEYEDQSAERIPNEPSTSANATWDWTQLMNN